MKHGFRAFEAFRFFFFWGGGSPWGCLHGGSWVVVSEVISPLIWLMSIVTLILTPFIFRDPAP